jgi:putative oxidoreductase
MSHYERSTQMDVVFLIGRILFGLLFVASALGAHLGPGGKQGREYARALGAPAPDLLVPLSGLVILAGGVMVALGIWADLGALLIIGFLVGITPIMHAFWKIDDPEQKAIQNAMFMKNTALLGAAIIIFWLYNQGQDLDLSITDALFSRID